MKSFRPLAALAALLPALVSAGPLINLWASNPGSVTVLGTPYAATAANATFTWNAGTFSAFTYARASTSAGTYEFQLVSVTATYPNYRIDGYWNVSRDGILLCANCLGYTDSFSSGAGKPFTIQVDGSNYKFTATIGGHHDF